MEMRKIAELSIQSQEDRLAVASILVKNGYTVISDKRKKTPSGKMLDYFIQVFDVKSDEGSAGGEL